MTGQTFSHCYWAKTTESPRGVQYYFDGKQLQAVRQGPWKLAIALQKEHNLAKGEAAPQKPRRPFVPTLYNLDTDIGEKVDVAAEHPDIVKRLNELTQEMDKDLGIKGDGPGVRPPGRVEHPKPLLMKHG